MNLSHANVQLGSCLDIYLEPLNDSPIGRVRIPRLSRFLVEIFEICESFSLSLHDIKPSSDSVNHVLYCPLVGWIVVRQYDTPAQDVWAVRRYTQWVASRYWLSLSFGLRHGPFLTPSDLSLPPPRLSHHDLEGRFTGSMSSDSSIHMCMHMYVIYT